MGRKWSRRALIAAGIVAAVILVPVFVLGKTYRIPSSAMEPTLRCARPVAGCSSSGSDRILALRLWLGMDPGRGDIVTFEMPDQGAARCGSEGVFVKRVIGLPGETVETRRGRVIVDGEQLEEPYVAHRDDLTTAPMDVPSGMYFLMGDNRRSSCDSRVFGPVPRDALIAKVVFRYWPLNRLGMPN